MLTAALERTINQVRTQPCSPVETEIGYPEEQAAMKAKQNDSTTVPPRHFELVVTLQEYMLISAKHHISTENNGEDSQML